MQVVEATTANGVCTLRVRALPLPSQVASVLDSHADLLRRLFDAPVSASHPNAAHALDDAPEAASTSNGHVQEGAPPAGLSESGASDTAPGSLSSQASNAISSRARAGTEELVAGVQGSGIVEQKQQEHRSGKSSTQQRSSSGRELCDSSAEDLRDSGEFIRQAAEGVARDVEAFRGRLRAAAEDAGGSAPALLQQAWMLGPKQV